MKNNFYKTQKRIGYSPLALTSPETYEELGLISGLEVHQQLSTDNKLFCHCPAGVFQKDGQYDAEVVRHMRPTLSEMGVYDGTALMEFKTKKTIVYRLANSTTCTYEVDDTPPFKLNQQALNIALEIALLLKTNIVGELHIARKQYLDGSIPAGFQRTGIISIEGQIPLKNKIVRIIQLSIEEDSCREVSDCGHIRVYTTDRLGIPLIETVTYPDMKTPEEVAEAAQYIRFLNRSTGKVRTGIGAAREDVNVSIIGGTRVEIKGVSHISYIPKLVHNEAFRQKSLLEIRNDLRCEIPQWSDWKISHSLVNADDINFTSNQIHGITNKRLSLVAVNLPGFRGILSFFTQPGRMFSDEISDRLKVIACIEKPNMTHSEDWYDENKDINFEFIHKLLNAKPEDAQILFWGPEDDIKTALETIDIAHSKLPLDVHHRITQLENWHIPEDTYFYLLGHNLVPLIEEISRDFNAEPKFIATLLAHRLKSLQGKIHRDLPFDYETIYKLFDFLKVQNIEQEILLDMLPVVYKHPNMEMISVLEAINFSKQSSDSIISLITPLRQKFTKFKTSKHKEAKAQYIMKNLRKIAIGNMPLHELANAIEREKQHYE